METQDIEDRESLTLSLGSLLMVFSGLRTRNTLRDLMVLMSRPLLFLCRKTDGVSIAPSQHRKYHLGFQKSFSYIVIVCLI